MIFASFLVHSFIVELGRAWKGKKERKKKPSVKKKIPHVIRKKNKVGPFGLS